MTPIDSAISSAAHDVQFYAKKLESELNWLESNIRDLRREVENGKVFEQRNLVSQSAAVAEVAGKLRAAHERLGILRHIAQEG